MPQHVLYGSTADPQLGTGSAHSAQETEHFRAMRAWVSLGGDRTCGCLQRQLPLRNPSCFQ